MRWKEVRSVGGWHGGWGGSGMLGAEVDGCFILVFLHSIKKGSLSIEQGGDGSTTQTGEEEAVPPIREGTTQHVDEHNVAIILR